ncbi:ABC transporter substrate-binding protein [Sporomusa acidovorans]|uniref:ABC transmembrane type-1 domain-containing protein n=1 Tax=Sporomusa acidovorans (strain ATCC 49682 / DSM 3132 / Mol) TaxID=1123286 RepID=A0ABZ3J4M9_SPOA4|nr:ABC transporter substrate-binding protein [Sporomusa acidovorans]OZC23950.1 nickel transport system permease protein NikB [Sporomusa acidovorans DSM 3132]SDF31948.1 ABC-type dipeptide/oligopeptide/nickel transport system, permease component [Sporomusa acidovorans]
MRVIKASLMGTCHFYINVVCTLALLGLAVVLTGCSGNTEQPPGPDKEIVLAAARDLTPGSKDPYYTSLILEVWEPLVGTGEDGRPAPRLAKSWEHSGDYREWVLQLAAEVRFHDGTPFDAAAVVKNFERYRVISPRVSTFYTFDINKIYPDLQQVEAVDEHTVRLTFSRPFPTLIYSMTNFGSAMFSPACFDSRTGDFITVAAGTGPFKIAGHVPKQYTLLARNDEYYGSKANAKTIRIKNIPGAETRYSALKTEEIMGVLDIGSLPPALTSELIKDGRFAVTTQKSSITHYLFCNGEKTPFNDPRMRKAVSLMVNRKILVRNFFHGYAIPTGNFLNSASPFSKEIRPERNPGQAKALAGDVLQGQTADITLLVPQYGIDRYPYKEIAEFLQAELKELGLHAGIVILEWAAIQDARATGRFDIILGTQGLPNFEPAILFKNYMKATGSANVQYRLGYQNQEAEQLLAQLDTASETADRATIYNRLQDIAAASPPCIPLFEDMNLAVYNKKLLNGSLGLSYLTQRPVLDELLLRLPVTLALAVSALLLVVFTGIPLGLLMVYHRDKKTDFVLRGAALLATSIPSFWLSIAGMWLFAEKLQLLPTSGYGTFTQLILPALALAAGTTGTVMRLQRAALLDVLEQNFILTARAKGLPFPVIIWRHGLPNALIPVITLLGNYFGAVIGGSAVIESVFSLPGLGSYVLEAVRGRDYPAIQGYVLFTGLIFVVFNLLVDLVYLVLNPQIRLGGK